MSDFPINTRQPEVGEIAQLGDEVALGIEPGERWGRIVGIIKKMPEDFTMKGAYLVIRMFQPDDTFWPTGDYCRAAPGIGCCPIVGSGRRDGKSGYGGGDE